MDTKLVNVELNIPLNHFKIELIKSIETLTEEDVDRINVIVFEELKHLSNNKDIHLYLGTEFPIQVWGYLFTLPQYVTRNIYFYTIEDIDTIRKYFDPGVNCYLVAWNMEN